jgi:hypothetical protein
MNIGSKKLTGLQPQTSYEWQVRTRCHAGPNIFSAYSAIQNFTTSPAREGDFEADLNPVAVTVFPNPPGSYLTVECSNWKGDATITIYSILGEISAQKIFCSRKYFSA